jgi:D-arabinose 1-dehydrogenase-like Zn-dependent alcohol dehydrogenase
MVSRFRIALFAFVWAVAYAKQDECAAPGKHKQVQLSKLDASFLDEIKVVEVPVPVPAAGEVLVHVRARPVNPADIFSLLGVYPGFTPKDFPAVPGLEGAGVIAQLGPGVKNIWQAEGIDLKVGSRVVPLLFDNVQLGKGSWTEYTTVAAASLVAIPDGVPDESAAQAIVNPITVLCMLDALLAYVKPDSGKDIYILQAAAGSTLGKQLIQIAKHRGIKTINLVRRSPQIEELKALGADEVCLPPSRPAPPFFHPPPLPSCHPSPSLTRPSLSSASRPLLGAPPSGSSIRTCTYPPGLEPALRSRSSPLRILSNPNHG